jgi:hypothetical protein
MQVQRYMNCYEEVLQPYILELMSITIHGTAFSNKSPNKSAHKH